MHLVKGDVRNLFLFSIFLANFTSPFLIKSACASDLKAEFKSLCRRDQSCHLLQNGGKWRLPVFSAMKKVCDHKDGILRAAESASVDPTLMSACLLSEHTFLVNFQDYLVDLLVKYGRARKSDPSVGFVQMKISVAREVYESVYGYNPSDDEVIEALLNDDLALQYMSVLLDQYQTTYQSYGFDAGPDILCTLYLIGGADARAEAHQRRSTRPQSNFYGFFAALHFDLARDLLLGDCSSRRLQQLSRQQNIKLNGTGNPTSNDQAN